MTRDELKKRLAERATKLRNFWYFGIAASAGPLGSDEKRIRKMLRRTTRFLVAAALMPVVAVELNLFFHIEPMPMWLARSGAPMTVMAIFAQVCNSVVGGLITASGFSTRELNELIVKYRPAKEEADEWAGAIIVTGTIVWGYGDLLWEHFLRPAIVFIF